MKAIFTKYLHLSGFISEHPVGCDPVFTLDLLWVKPLRIRGYIEKGCNAFLKPLLKDSSDICKCSIHNLPPITRLVQSPWI